MSCWRSQHRSRFAYRGGMRGRCLESLDSSRFLSLLRRQPLRQAPCPVSTTNTSGAGFHVARSNATVKVLDTVLLGPPVVTFPHQCVESFFEISLGGD